MVNLAVHSGIGERGPFVKQSPFTADRELVQALEKRSQPIFCSEDCLLFCQGDPAVGLYILRSGSAVLTLKSESGQIVMCFEAGASSLLGLPAILVNAPYSLNALAQKGSIVRFVSREDFEDVIRLEPSLSVLAFQVIAAEVIAARKAIAEN